MTVWEFISLDLPPLLAAVFTAIACALLGNYLLLQRLSLMGDAISHSVLPGIVIAFLLTTSRAALPVFIGAAVAGILCTLLVQLVRRYGKVEPGASMGVVFSIFFALGVLLIEQAAARSIDLDADCLLHGQLESIFWAPPHSLGALFSLSTLALLPAEVSTGFVTMAVTIAFVALLYKELKISSFDPALATTLGFSSSLLYGVLMVFVAAAVVASFKIVGSILVIAMIICPPATARLYTDRLPVQIGLSCVFAVLPSLTGYVLGAFGPIWLGYANSISAAGMMAVMCGVFLGGSVLMAPRYGVLAKALRNLNLTLKIREEDILGLLYRVAGLAKDSPRASAFTGGDIKSALGEDWMTSWALRRATRKGLVVLNGGAGALTLSASGLNLARNLIRSHRLWESYLVKILGMPLDHVHSTAERLEHFTGQTLQAEISQAVDHSKTDPHGKVIP